MAKDWLAWHASYDEPGSALQRRLAVVQGHVSAALAACPPGPIRVVSMCAGQGRDLLGPLADHPRRDDVTARLVELDGRNVARARAAVSAAGLDGVEVVQGDASPTDAYEGAVPTDVVLACGVFGNVSDDDVRTTIDGLSMLCAVGATVVWTRHPREPSLLPAIDGWFRAAGFELVALDVDAEGRRFGVGMHRLAVEPAPFRQGIRLFTFRS